MRLRRSTRLRTFDCIGIHRYFVTVCTEWRAPRFVDSDAVNAVLSQLLRTSDAHAFAVIAYCFMPDHLHVLAEGTSESSDLRAFIRAFKQRTAFEWKQRHESALWERSYFERVLRDEEDSSSVARYIVANPVRAGLVKDPVEHPYSGSAILGMSDLLESLRPTARA